MRKPKKIFRGVLIVLLVLAALLASPYLFLNREKQTLDAAARAGVPGEFIALGAGTTHFERAGPADGQVVVLVHGVSVPYFIWDGTFKALADAGFHVLRFDLYGRGYSDRPDAAYTTDYYVQQIIDLLAALGVRQPVDLAGVSLGGYLAAAFADQHPEQIRRLVMLDPGPSSPAFFNSTVNFLASPILGRYFVTALGNLIWEAGQKADFFDPAKMPADYLKRYQVQMRYRGFKRAQYATLSHLASLRPGHALMDMYARVDAQGRPVLLIWGREDKTSPFADNVTLRQAMPHAEFHAIDAAGHLPHIEQPQVVNPLLIEFLRRQ
jgi:pimeloyl-ACP methyl ester carboxylesterase